MNPKSAGIISGGLMLTVAIAILIALVLPGWFKISTYPGYSGFLGPIISCVGEYYFENCVANDSSCGGNEYCEKLSASRAFLIIGEIFAIVSVIALFVGVCRRARVLSNGFKFFTIGIQAFTALCFLISFALVANVYLGYYNGSPNVSYGPSFILTVISMILVIASLVLFSVFSFFVKSSESSNSTMESPLISTSYNSAATGVANAQPGHVTYQNPAQFTNAYPQQGQPYMHQQPHAQPFVYQQYQQAQ